MVFPRSVAWRKVYVVKCRGIQGTLYQYQQSRGGGEAKPEFWESLFASAAALASYCMCHFCISLWTWTLQSEQGHLQAAMSITGIHFLLLPEGDPRAWNLEKAYCPATGPGLFLSHSGCNLLEARECRRGFCYLSEQLHGKFSCNIRASREKDNEIQRMLAQLSKIFWNRIS